MAAEHKATDLRRLPAQVLSPGVSRRLFEGDDAILILYEFAADAEAPVHEHGWEHLGYALRGQITIGLPDHTVTVSAGDVYHIPANLPHSGRAGPEGAALLESRARPR